MLTSLNIYLAFCVPWGFSTTEINDLESSLIRSCYQGRLALIEEDRFVCEERAFVDIFMSRFK